MNIGHRISSSEDRKGRNRAAVFFLVGPTAVGKTEIAHQIALEDGCEILSADAMLVYRGMDIGTAKPSADQMAEVRYHGIDLVEPNDSFSVGHYYEYAHAVLRQASEREQSVIVVGGTGLYVKSLVAGLDDHPPADEDLRAELEHLLQAEGLAALQARLKNEFPERFTQLSDPQNPRRLIRAFERPPVKGSEWQLDDLPVMVGLNLERELLRHRARSRIVEMYAAGLLEEVRGLQAEYGSLSKTAAQAIGYCEALSVLAGECDVETAVERTFVRTCRLAKRQMTWFRNQLNVSWLDVAQGQKSLAAAVRELWCEHECKLVDLL